MRHIGWNTPYRFPAPKGAIENALFGLGYAFRALGMAFDTVGATMQLRGGELKETGKHIACRNLNLGYHIHQITQNGARVSYIHCQRNSA